MLGHSEQRIMTTIIRVISLLCFLLSASACQQAATPDQQVRDRLTSEAGDASIGELSLISSSTPEGLKIACQIDVLMNPAEGMLMPSPLAEKIVAVTSSAVQELFPGAVSLNLFVTTWPDTAKYQSPESIDLDGNTLRMGMSRTEVRAVLEDSDWSVSHDGIDQWGLSGGWPRRSRLYFENNSEAAKVVFLIPVQEKASGGGIDSLVANFNFPQTAE